MMTDYRFIELHLQLNRIAAHMRTLTEEVNNAAVMADELERDNQLAEINSSQFTNPKE